MSAPSGGEAPDTGLPVSANDPITAAVTHRDGSIVVTLGGEIDLYIAPALEAAIAEALAVDAKAVIIGMSAVEFLASAALQHALTAVHIRLVH